MNNRRFAKKLKETKNLPVDAVDAYLTHMLYAFAGAAEDLYKAMSEVQDWDNKKINWVRPFDKKILEVILDEYPFTENFQDIAMMSSDWITKVMNILNQPLIDEDEDEDYPRAYRNRNFE